jgi:hypothetical protein
MCPWILLWNGGKDANTSKHALDATGNHATVSDRDFGARSCPRSLANGTRPMRGIVGENERAVGAMTNIAM